MAQYLILKDGLSAARQLEKEVTSACREALKKGMDRISALKSREDWEALRAELNEVFRGAFPEIMNHRAPIEARTVSVREYDDFVQENLLFCSLPGWEVNATLYRPKKKGKYPGVICPLGHAEKWYPDHYRSAQSIARNGDRLDKCVEELDANVTQLGSDVRQFKTE